MKKGKTTKLLAVCLTAALLSGCGKSGGDQPSAAPVETAAQEAAPQTDREQDGETAAGETDFQIGERPSLIARKGQEGEAVTAAVEPYAIEADLGNVQNLEQFYLTEEMKQMLAQNGFMVMENGGKEFFDIYEVNRYSQIPSFVTVDSLMHTYHLYFAYLLRNIERETLSEQVKELGQKMLADSLEQYTALKGSEWESAAMRNVAFFAVGAKLMDEKTAVPKEVEEIVSYELSQISSAAEIADSTVTGKPEDYTQYQPRGYYAGDDRMEAYFRAMMWYGRIHFTQEEEDLDRSALLITRAMEADEEAYRLWDGIYAVTSFFAGASDDSGICEYEKLLRQVYGEQIPIEKLIGDQAGFEEFHKLTAQLEPPQINSLPIKQGEENIIPGFRFMGQRFTIDGAIMQNLIYQAVKENGQGEKRMLPDVLDVPAALGSDTALEILEQAGAAEFEGYSQNMQYLRESLSEEDTGLFTASLYGEWLNVLRPLLTPKGEGYPVFMQNEEWNKKDLECFAGSFTELKHDTVLYSKQVMAEMGGGYEEELDDRGYVEPEPYVYERFAGLAEQTAEGLKAYGMLGKSDEDNLQLLSELAQKLYAISVKELKEETLTEEEYELIRSYGGNLEHFWYETVKDESEDGQIASQLFPAAVVVDIATDPNGQILEAATGDPSTIWVVVKVDGKLKIARGSTYTFYQFAWPMEERMTDESWRVLMGIAPDENGEYQYDTKMDQPEWTASYRYTWN